MTTTSPAAAPTRHLLLLHAADALPPIPPRDDSGLRLAVDRITVFGATQLARIVAHHDSDTCRSGTAFDELQVGHEFVAGGRTFKVVAIDPTEVRLDLLPAA